MEAGEEIREAAAQEPRAIRGVLQAQRGDEAEVREKIARQLGVEAERIGAGEHEHAIELLVPAQRNQRKAAELAVIRGTARRDRRG